MDLDIGGEKFNFSRQRISKEGWLALDPYQYRKVKNEEFPDIKEGEKLKLKLLVKKKKQNLLQDIIRHQLSGNWKNVV